ncbi:hypothetical protein [Streptomyces sp. NPDC056190]|uniref:hypothetical protein n=1 Tax=Streptomyces sp. NPDC056190 TaxID=3345741 RepID=UPI0035DADF18
MGRRLAAAVHVQHPKTNEWLILQPGEEPDEELAAVITNPDAWEPDEDEEGEDAGEVSPDPETVPLSKPEPTQEPAPAPEAKPRSRTRKQADA